jgi:hypothetical protein
LDSIQHADRNPNRMSAVIDFPFMRPIFTNRQLDFGLKIPFKTAGQYVEKLIHEGIFRETTGYARNRIFRANEILQALEGLGYKICCAGFLRYAHYGNYKFVEYFPHLVSYFPDKKTLMELNSGLIGNCQE